MGNGCAAQSIPNLSITWRKAISHTPATLPHIYIRYEAGQTPEIVLTLRNTEKPLPLQ